VSKKLKAIPITITAKFKPEPGDTHRAVKACFEEELRYGLALTSIKIDGLEALPKKAKR
jgi:hypothetical protein